MRIATLTVLFVAGAHLVRGALPLERVVEIAHARGVPVIVDAAAHCSRRAGDRHGGE